MTIFRRQQRAPRLWLPSDDGRAIRIDMVAGARREADGARIEGPLKIGYGDECDLKLNGGVGPDVLLELQRTDSPLRLTAVPSSEDLGRCIELSVNGQRVTAPVQELEPGSRVEVLEKSSGVRYAMVVDPPRPAWLRPKAVLAVLSALTLAGGIYGAYLYLALERTQGSLTEARGQIAQASRQFDEVLRRLESAEADFGQSILALRGTLDAAEQQLRGDFDRRLAEIGRRSTERLEQVEARDVLARTQLENRTQIEIEQLRAEFSDRMVAAYRDFKNVEGRVTDALSKRMDSLEPASERFKRVFHSARDSVVFVQVRYRIEFTRSGEVSQAGAFGTGYLVNASGLGLTAQHVLYPWRFDDRLAVLRKLDLARVPPESVHWSIWPTGVRVATQVAATHDDASSGYHSGSLEKGMRVLYAPEPTTVKAQVSAPIGMVEVSVPRPDHTDVAVFQLMAFDRSLRSIPDIDPDLTIEALDETLAIGYPFSQLQDGMAFPQGVRGSVRRVGPRMVELDTPLHPGLSGAPVLDHEGRLLGMVVAVLQSEVYGVAIRAQSLSDTLQRSVEAVRLEEERLEAIGCAPGPNDGVFDRDTEKAYECESRQSAVSDVDSKTKNP